MIKLCVKKPFTVLVAVIVCLSLAAVSLTRMTTDLLPEMSMPYMIVITTYPGASPEKIESTVTAPLEGQLGTVSHVKNVTSTSSENYCMIMLEFEDDTNMDSSLVKVNAAIQAAGLPEECGSPNVMEISMDMMATQYLSVSYDGMDIYELSDFVEETVTPYYERQGGVSSVSDLGLVQQSVEVRLEQDKIDRVNAKIRAHANDKLADAEQELNDAQKDIDDAKEELDDGNNKLEREQGKTSNQLGEASLGLNTALATKAAYEAELASEQAKQTALQMELQAYQDAGVEQSYEQMDQLFDTLRAAAGGKEAHDAMYDQVYQQILIAAVQSLIDGQSAPPSSSETETPDVSIPDISLPDGSGNGDTSENTAENTAPSAPDTPQLPGGKITVTADNVDAILDSLGKDTADALRSTCAEAAEDAVQEQLDEIAGQLPSSVDDAIDHPEKLAAAVTLLEQQGQGDVAAQLTAENLGQLQQIVEKRIPNIQSELDNLTVEIATAQAVCDSVNEAVSSALESYSTVEAGKILAAAGFGSASAQLASAKSAIESGEDQLEEARDSLDEARETTLKNANIDALLDMETLSQLIYAQNFAMPAGYIDDKDDNQWMLKIGDSFASLDEIQNLLLAHIDGVGDVRLNDLAQITVIDNAGESYTRVNGEEAVAMAVYKNSTAGTSAVSKECDKAGEELQEQYDGLHISVLMDQGDYIGLFLDNILHSMLIGAALAILVLIVFLKDAIPTIVVAFSIPFSVLVAALLMYFSDISLNLMSLGGLSLGIGMLVDNSIVVIENIYRLRHRGLESARASVQGARQVEGAIISSTLTTVCVFLPMIFTSGLTRQLMLPFALTIAFSLTASLVVALTVVPTLASVLLRRAKQKQHPLFDRMLNAYGRMLDFCLRVKIVPLGVAVALLAFSVFGVLRMGIVLIPDMASNQITASFYLDEDIDKESSYAIADQVTDAILQVDGVDVVGVLGNASALISSELSEDDYSSYGLYIIPDESIDKEREIYDLCDAIQAQIDQIKGVDADVSASAMGSMSSMLGSGLSVNLYGEDLDTLLSISHDFEDIISGVEGFTDASNGQEEADQTLHLVIDRDKAMRLGLTTAQIFQQISKDLTTEQDAVNITLDGHKMDIVIVNETKLPTRETLLDEVFETTSTDDDGETVTEEHELNEFAELETAEGLLSISRDNNLRYLTVTAATEEGYNTTRLTEKTKSLLDAYDMPDGYYYEISGEYENVSEMVTQMMGMTALGFLFIYLVMVAQFQSLLSPFIILFTVPLAFTGGFIGLLLMGEQLSLFSLMGFLVLMGTVVNNGIVFVDYVNQLRLGGMRKRDALIATGKTRMRPILMTAMTTILAMGAMVFDTSTSAGMNRGMATVVAAGLAYATLMTLFIVPVIYDILYRKQPHEVDVGDDTIDDAPDDAAEFIAQLEQQGHE